MKEGMKTERKRETGGEKDKESEKKRKRERERETEKATMCRECLAHEQVYLLVTDRYSAPIIEERPTLNSA